MVQRTMVFIFLIFTLIFYPLDILKASPVFDCLNLTISSSESDKDYCRNELDNLLLEQADLESKVKELSKQTGTIKGDITVLTAQINALKAKVKARALVIAQLKVSIKEKVNKISSLNSKIDREHASLAQLLRNTNEFDDQNVLGIILSDQNISSFYGDLESYASIKKAIKVSVDQIRGVKIETEVQKKDLEKKQNAETDAKAELEAAQKKVTQSEIEKKKLLALKTQETGAYQKLAAEKKARADKIRRALFSLAGISQKIEFGTALAYANEAKQKFGIDPAFLLAIFTQESNLGSNVGQCNIPNTPKWSEIMPGPTEYQTYLNRGKTCKNSLVSCSSRDDQTPFLSIVDSLGINPFSIALSCPIKSAGPWGGAMGPAQFIPSTWNGYIERLKNTLGHNANPWDPRDAFIASAMKLTDNGAIGNSASAQNRAACRYYGSGGSSCGYSRSVAKLKSRIQANIDLLSN